MASESPDDIVRIKHGDTEARGECTREQLAVVWEAKGWSADGVIAFADGTVEGTVSRDPADDKVDRAPAAHAPAPQADAGRKQ